ncbi:MAG: hypothetical protein GXO69_11435 [Acidobacteria bacterium]|nr:hypothetical protein [Acidobacteriota bacterium]
MRARFYFSFLFAVMVCVALSIPVLGDEGNNSCLECHDSVQASIARTPHTFANHVSCEACHGPGNAHAKDPSANNIRSFKNSSAKEIVATCTKCHSDKHPLLSSHLSNGQACLECHSLGHSPVFTDNGKRPERRLLKNISAKLCTRCHAGEKAKMNRPYHHPSDPFGNVCLSCHNPHKTKIELRQNKVDKKCSTCHPETGGPFMYVHLGTQNRGCSECHDPHGSTNPNLLNRNTTRFLCLSCHSDTPDFHNLADPKFRQCTSCHSAIHGSNTSAVFLE